MSVELERILTQIVVFLKDELNLKQEHSLAIISLLRTTKHALLMLDYLEKNKNNKCLMRIDNLLNVARRISED